MRAIMGFGGLMLAAGVALAASATQAAADQTGRVSGTRVAQTCGYFAILGCFKSARQAVDWNERIQGGRVINTSSESYPNFRPGYFCVAAGPTSQGTAQSIMRSWRGVVPDAYVKSSC